MFNEIKEYKKLNSVLIGESIDNEFLEGFVNARTSVNKSGPKWAGDFIIFRGSDEEIRNGNHLHQAPDGATIRISEMFVADMHLYKRNNQWIVFSIQYQR